MVAVAYYNTVSVLPSMLLLLIEFQGNEVHSTDFVAVPIIKTFCFEYPMNVHHIYLQCY